MFCVRTTWPHSAILASYCRCRRRRCRYFIGRHFNVALVHFVLLFFFSRDFIWLSFVVVVARSICNREKRSKWSSLLPPSTLYLHFLCIQIIIHFAQSSQLNDALAIEAIATANSWTIELNAYIENIEAFFTRIEDATNEISATIWLRSRCCRRFPQFIDGWSKEFRRRTRFTVMCRRCSVTKLFKSI